MAGALRGTNFAFRGIRCGWGCPTHAPPGVGLVLLNYAGREINAKVVYYGPGLSGKTTNLECIYASVPKDSRGKMVSMKTRQDRTLFFDFLPLELGEVHGFRTRFLLYTVPGQVFYNATRKLVLKGADAVVFVADSTQGRIEENRESLNNLRQNLEEHNLSLDSIPWVIQYNKRDLPKVHTIAELEEALNPSRVPHYEAAAATGRGVYETLHAVSTALFQRLVQELKPHAPNVAPAQGAVTGTGPGVGAIGVAAPQARQSAPRGAAVPVQAQQANTLRPKDLRGGSPRAVEPNTLDLPEIAVQVLAQNSSPTDVETPSLQGIATQLSVQVHAQAGSEVVPSSVEAVSEYGPLLKDESNRENAFQIEKDNEYGEFGHTVDLALEPQESDQVDPGFIKDPLQRPQTALDVEKGGSAPTPASKTLRVPVRVSARDFVGGATVRIVLDLRVEK